MNTFPKHYFTVVIAVACPTGFINAVYADSIEEVVVTASPFSKSAETVNHPVNLLSSDALKNAAATTLGETISGQLGVSSASFGPGVGLPIIRGQSDNRVKVMQDSVGSMDASSASPDHAVTLEPLLASKIEVLRGPAALRYGSGAIGGVVNVLDNRIPNTLPGGATGGAELRNASANDETAGVVNLNTAASAFAFHIDGVKRTSGDMTIPGYNNRYNKKNSDDNTTKGFIANTDAESQSGTFGTSFIGDKGFIGLSVNKLDNNYGIPPDANELVRIDMHQTRYDMKGEYNNPLPGVEKLTARIGHNDYQHVEQEKQATTVEFSDGTKFTNNAYEGRIELIHKPITFLSLNWKGATGIQAAQSTFAAVGEEAFIPKSNIDSLGFFALEERTQGYWTFELGARADTQSITPEGGSEIKHNSLNLSGSTAWHFTDNQKVVVGLAHSNRAPSVEELLAHGPHPATGSYLIGNENLSEETSNNIELGYHWHTDEIKISANIFYNHINDFIYARNEPNPHDNQCTDKGDLNCYIYTQANATFKGLEAEIKLPLSTQWNLRFFGDSVRATLDNDEDLPRITPPRIGSSIDYDWETWSGNLSFTHAAQQHHAGNNESKTESYNRVDARISYTLKTGTTNCTLFLKANNLLNAEIRNASSYLRDIAPEAGRNLQVGVRVTFE